MKQEYGWGAAIAVAVAAAIGISSQYGGKPAAEITPATTAAPKSPRSTPVANGEFERGPCVEIEQHLQSFLLSRESKSIAAPDSCFPSTPTLSKTDGDEMRQKATHLRFVIATLPDPIHTHFSLSFDRLAEAIQQGATDEQYIYDSSWLPWEPEEPPFALFDDQDKADDRKKAREDQPGILLFRKDPASDINAQTNPYDQGLVVFVVGEEPTQGIHRMQFQNAAAWIAALQPRVTPNPPAYKLPERILGPSFSGSLPSLASLLVNIGNSKSSPSTKAGTALAEAPKSELFIYSGSVTSSSGVRRFLDAVQTDTLDVHFSSFQQNDNLMISRYCKYLEQSQFDLRHLAILSEDETAYGNEFGHKSTETAYPCDSNDLRPARLFYPRDISALRTAYQKESIFNPQTSQSPTDSVKRTLSTDIADPEGEQHDSIRDYSASQTALSQEAVLQQIVSLLRIHQSEYILLRSSNPLDQLFLSHYLRLVYPQGRIVILGADLLLRRESGAARLSGIMTLNTYPLLPWESHWTRARGDSNSHSHRVFPQDGAEGTYIATRFLLQSSIQRGQKLTLASIIQWLIMAGYSEEGAPTVSKVGTFSLTGYNLLIHPGTLSHMPQGEVLIQVQEGVVHAILDDEGKMQSSYELGLRPRDNFLPADPILQIPDYGLPFWARKDGNSQSFVNPPAWVSFLKPDPLWPLANRGIPFWTMEDRNFHRTATPPTWISVLGRDNFWPLAALDGSPLQAGEPTPKSTFKQRSIGLRGAIHAGIRSLAHILPLGTKEASVDDDENWHPWPSMPLSMKVALTALAIWSVFHLVCCAFPSITVKPSHRAYFVCISHSYSSHRALLVLGSFALSSMATVFAWGFGVMSPAGEPLLHPRLCTALLPLLWLIAVSSLAINLFRQRESLPATSPESPAPSAPQTEDAAHNQTESIALPEQPVRPDSDPVRFLRSPGHWTKRHWPILWPLLVFGIATIAFYLLIFFSLDQILVVGNRIPTYWRSMNLTSGVSPLIPLLALCCGIYLWSWYSLQGLALFGLDRPLLPPENVLKFELNGKMVNWMGMFSRQQAAEPVEARCWPFAKKTLGLALFLFLVLGLFCFLLAGEVPIRSLGAKPYSILICVFMDVCVSLMLANAWQFLQIWLDLRKLLNFLNRMRLRRSMAAFLDSSWASIWNISGNVLDMRYKLLVSQLECVGNLQNALSSWENPQPLFQDHQPPAAVTASFNLLNDARQDFAGWYAANWNQANARDQQKLEKLQECIANTAGTITVEILRPAWARETATAIPNTASAETGASDDKRKESATCASHLERHICLSERFVCYVYLGFIQNILGRMRSLVMAILWLFIAATVSMANYPFDPRPVVSGATVMLFLALGTVIVVVYAQMHRDPILSLLTNTKPGELGGDFWLKLAGFGAGPVLGLLATLFPGFTDALFSWIQPGISTIK